jgi:FkbM family methyltransferase
MKYHSQNDEEKVILDYFGDFKGTFCDIGANDGETFSNTRALAMKGWSGAYIEASPKAYDKLFLLESYGHTFKTSVAIGARKRKIILHESGELVGRDDVALVSTVHKHEMDRFRKTVNYQPIEVECITWYDFLRSSPWQIFHFISMDIEGSELEVLPQMDLTDVKMFCIEWNSKPELKKAYEPYFEGFKLIHTTGENLIWAR